jgi:hypothetical protein
LADDPWGLYCSQKSWFSPKADPVHFMTLPFAIYYGLWQAFQLNPLPYHLFKLALLVLNACLVKTLAEHLELDSWQCWFAALLVLFNSVAAEAYFWFATFITVAMTGLVAAGLLCLARFRRSRFAIWAAGYLGMVLLAPFMDAKGILLPLLGFTLDRFWPTANQPDGKPGSWSGYRLHLAALAIAGAIMLLRLFLGLKSSWVNLPLRNKFLHLKINLVSTFFHGLDDLLIGLFQQVQAVWTNVFPALWLLLLVLLVLGLVLGQGADRRRLFTFILLWLISCLPQTLGGSIQYRYFYLPGVFVALVIVQLLGGFSRRLASRRLAAVLVSLVVAGYLFLDIRGFQLALSSFREASRIYQSGVKQITALIPNPDREISLVLIDFPFYIYNRQARVVPRPDRIPYVNLFAFPLAYHLKLLYQRDDITVTFARLSPPRPENPCPLGDQVSPEQLKEMLSRPHTRGLRFIPGDPPQVIKVEDLG